MTTAACARFFCIGLPQPHCRSSSATPSSTTSRGRCSGKATRPWPAFFVGFGFARSGCRSGSGRTGTERGRRRGGCHATVTMGHYIPLLLAPPLNINLLRNIEHGILSSFQLGIVETQALSEGLLQPLLVEGMLLDDLRDGCQVQGNMPLAPKGSSKTPILVICAVRLTEEPTIRGWIPLSRITSSGSSSSAGCIAERPRNGPLEARTGFSGGTGKPRIQTGMILRATAPVLDPTGHRFNRRTSGQPEHSGTHAAHPPWLPTGSLAARPRSCVVWLQPANQNRHHLCHRPAHAQ